MVLWADPSPRIADELVIHCVRRDHWFSRLGDVFGFGGRYYFYFLPVEWGCRFHDQWCCVPTTYHHFLASAAVDAEVDVEIDAAETVVAGEAAAHPHHDENPDHFPGLQNQSFCVEGGSYSIHWNDDNFRDCQNYHYCDDVGDNELRDEYY